MGHTDRKGRVLLDSLLPYETNTVSVDPLELPFDASLATTAMTVTPAYRSGPVVKFPVVRARPRRFGSCRSTTPRCRPALP